MPRQQWAEIANSVQHVIEAQTKNLGFFFVLLWVIYLKQNGKKQKKTQANRLKNNLPY